MSCGAPAGERRTRRRGRRCAALTLLTSAASGPPDALRAAEIERLRGEIAFAQGHAGEAARQLLNAAKQLEPLDSSQSRETYLFTHGYPAAAPQLTKALAQALQTEIGADDVGSWLWLAGNRAGGTIAIEVAVVAARQVFEQDIVGYGVLVVSELAEAASRTGDTKLVETTLAWLTERTNALPTDWGLGIESRVRALLTSDETAYRESLDHLSRTTLRVEIARAHLLYGEWLRRAGSSRRCPRATPDGRRPVDRDGTRRIRRACPARAARDR